MSKTTQIAPAVYTVAEFCQAHKFTPKHLYDLIRRGEGPRIMKSGTRTLISLEAAAAWRREREAGAQLMEPRSGRRATPAESKPDGAWVTAVCGLKSSNTERGA